MNVMPRFGQVWVHNENHVEIEISDCNGLLLHGIALTCLAVELFTTH